MGGLLAVEYLAKHPEIQPTGMVLLAPVLSLKFIARSIFLTAFLPDLGLTLPSFLPKQYRRFPGTPVRWYNNVRLMLGQLSSLRSSTALSAIPTLVIGSPRDELISMAGVEEWIHANSLQDLWCVKWLSPTPQNRSLPEHLMIDRESLGTSGWNTLAKLISVGFSGAPYSCP